MKSPKAASITVGFFYFSGVQEQIPGVCPGISGYCSDGFVGQVNKESN